MARPASLLEQALRNAFGKGPSTRPAMASQTHAMNHYEEVIGERVQDP